MSPPTLCYTLQPWLWAGSYLGNGNLSQLSEHIAWLQNQHITHIIDLTAPSDELPRYADTLALQAPQITRLSFPINDGDISSPPHMLAILDALSAAEHANHVVYVHCWRGTGRTGMVLACWLMRHGYTAAAALAQLAQIPEIRGLPIPAYQVQIDFVMRWQEPDAVVAQRWRRIRAVFRGTLFGGAVGDALGISNELRNGPAIQQINDIVGGGIFGVAPGTWTDDTSLMLCVADSLIEQQGFDAHDQANRFVRWWRDGYLACGGRTYDIGNVTTMALFHYMQTGIPQSKVTSDHAAGTGALIRMAPLGLFYAAHPNELVEYAKRSSMITHAAPTAVHAGQLVALMIARALYCTDKDQLVLNQWWCEPLDPAVAEVMSGSYRYRQPPDIHNSTHVVRTLEAVMWSMWRHDSYVDGVLQLANLGAMSGAACTTYGQIAGAFYGEAAIPPHWIARLQRHDEIAWFAEMLLRVAWRSFVSQAEPKELFARRPLDPQPA